VRHYDNPANLMSETGLGCVKTPAPAASVENLKAIAHYERQIILRTYSPMLWQRTVFSTFRQCMSFTQRALGADGLCVTAQGLKVGFDELLETSSAHARAWKSGAAAAPTHAAEEDSGAHARRAADRFGLRPPDPQERWER
jgi:hypothetical protein